MLIAYLVLLCEFFWEFSSFHFCRPLVDIYWHPFLNALFAFDPCLTWHGSLRDILRDVSDIIGFQNFPMRVLGHCEFLWPSLREKQTGLNRIFSRLSKRIIWRETPKKVTPKSVIQRYWRWLLSEALSPLAQNRHRQGIGSGSAPSRQETGREFCLPNGNYWLRNVNIPW